MVFILCLIILYAITFLLSLTSFIVILILRHRSKPVKSPYVVGVTLFPAVLLFQFTLPLLPLPSFGERDALPYGSDQKLFDTQIWQETSPFTGEEVTERQKMLKDLVTNILPSKNRDEIVVLLGHPQSTQYNNSECLGYELGCDRRSLFGVEWLYIWLDNEGRFKEYQIVGID